MRTMGVPYPTEKDITEGKFNHLMNGGNCSNYWIKRFLLKIEDRKILPTKALQEIWKKDEVRTLQSCIG